MADPLGFLARPVNAIVRATMRSIESGTPGIEGQKKQGPWYLIGPNGGWLPDAWGQYWNFWQMDLDPMPGGSSAIVEACVAAYAQTISQCPAGHWRSTGDGGKERITTSALSRILRKPNDYQTSSDFIYNLVRHLYLTGNNYALAERNDRYEVSALHLFDPTKSKPVVVPGGPLPAGLPPEIGNGEIFYSLVGNNIAEARFSTLRRGATEFIIPARNCMHMKLEAKRDEPLIGISPLRHANDAVAAQNAIGSQLINFFHNMSRPSGVLSTDLALTAPQVQELRARWEEQAKGLNQGGVPILTQGLKYQGISLSAKDADLVNSLKMTDHQVCLVYGVPPAILGIEQTNFASTEAMMQFWLTRGLGFAMNHVEVAFDHFFGLPGYPIEWVELDSKALLRPMFKERIEAIVRGVQGGVYSPNEARAEEELPSVEFGDEPRVQQQVVPLSAAANIPAGTANIPPAPPSPPAGPAADAPGGDDEGDDDADSKDFLGAIHQAAERYDERKRQRLLGS